MRCNRLRHALLAAFRVASILCRGRDYASYVDPFIGTEGDGNTFPGASMPFGMVKLGPDCGDRGSNPGYRAGATVRGFSHLHVSGTGGGPKYGNILVFPFTGELTVTDYGSGSTAEHAEPGYYRTSLDNGAVAELTCTDHTGAHRYNFTRPGRRGILVDTGSILGENACCGENQVLLGSEVEILSDHEITGQNRVSGGWNTGDAFTVYFYATFSAPATEYGTWKSGRATARSTAEYDSGEPVGAWFGYAEDTDTVEVRVGISFISRGKARQNCMAESAGIPFDVLRAAARGRWNACLGRIDADSTDPAALRRFYTALYHTLLQPVDKTGENSRWVSPEPYYDDFYCLWDTFRTSHPLLTLIAPADEARIVNSLIDIYRHSGYMPDGRSGDSNGRTQGGSNAEMVVADALLKDLPGIDADEALEAMLKDAEVPPGDDERRHGRGGLSDYIRLGYVSTDYERAGTRTLEYAANDWAIAQCAAKAGRHDLAEKYSRRAASWENLWRPVVCDSVCGFIMPRRSDGEWDDSYREPTWDYYTSTPPCRLRLTPPSQLPDSCRRGEPFTPHSHGSWPNFFYETNSWEYSFYVPHDVSRLIEKCGGTDSFVSRLDRFFDSGYFNINNEPGFLIPCLYLWAGRHDRTVERVNRLLTNHFSDGRDGLPGNDDSGAMSAWYVFHNIGFFPNAGQDVYLLTAPRFKRTRIDLGGGRILTVEADNLSPDNIYVESVTIDGKPWHKSWFSHADIARGATIRFRMSPRPGKWERTAEAPPSR